MLQKTILTLPKLERIGFLLTSLSESATTTGFVMAFGEITTNAVVDYQKIIRETIKDIGYDNCSKGMLSRGVVTWCCHVVLSRVNLIVLYYEK